MTTLEIVLLCIVVWGWGTYAFVVWEHEIMQRRFGFSAILVAVTVPIFITLGTPALFIMNIVDSMKSRRNK